MIKQVLSLQIKKAVEVLYSHNSPNIQLQNTVSDFEGDITLVVFPLLSISMKSAEDTANELGKFLIQVSKEVEDFNVIKGFLNLKISNKYWFKCFQSIYPVSNFGFTKPKSNSPTYLVEYSSPNTNKPLHLGHIRNILLGFSVSEILKATGKNVKKVQIINDRGIHICKSMVAWKEYGSSETPLSSDMKGDHFVGKYYVKFESEYQKQISYLVKNGFSVKDAKNEAPIFKKAQEMLRLWESKDPHTIKLWNMMNNWVYEGFSITYERLAVDFDKNYYESNTYLLGKEIVQKGLVSEIFFQKSDGSVWVDLSDEGLDEKLLLRSDGTSVYITQDIGTAVKRKSDFNFNNIIYTVGNEQDYHFKVLFLILKKMGYSWSNNCHHLSYGMVDLPSGKMKSREGTVVDADDLIQEMVITAKKLASNLGKLQSMNDAEAENLYKTVGLAALKYFILKVDPRKKMLFNPEESVDFNGNTGPFIQYTYARIKSLKRKFNDKLSVSFQIEINEKEKSLIKLVLDFPSIINEAAKNYSPAIVANYVYEISKEYNNFYQSYPILNAQNDNIIRFRLALSVKVGEIIKSSMKLLGIEVPNRM